jgi:hypothetical protein
MSVAPSLRETIARGSLLLLDLHERLSFYYWLNPLSKERSGCVARPGRRYPPGCARTLGIPPVGVDSLLGGGFYSLICIDTKQPFWSSLPTCFRVMAMFPHSF